MIKFKIGEIAKRRGLTTAFALQKALNCSPTMASRLFKGGFKQVSIETIDRLCDLFGCLPSNLYEYKPNNSKAVKSSVSVPNSQNVEKGMLGRLTTNEVAERLNLSRKRVNDYVNKGLLPAEKVKGQNYISEADFVEFEKLYRLGVKTGSASSD
jgi:excisionase family DNA binding protein